MAVKKTRKDTKERPSGMVRKEELHPFSRFQLRTLGLTRGESLSARRHL